jgi:acetyl esterase/lipase
MANILKNLYFLLTLCFIFIDSPAFAEASPTAESSPLQVVRDIKYSNAPYCSGDLYQIRSKQKSPVVIVIHGGGWQKGDKSDLYLSDVVNYLPTHGYAVFSINYRLTTQGGCFPNSVKDVVNAAHWLTANAEKYSLDPSRIAMLGESAGGNLALMAAYNINGKSFRKADDKQKLSICAAIAFSPVIDLSTLQKGFINDYMDDTVEHSPSLFKDASPLSYIDKAVPTLCVHGCADNVIPVEQSRHFVDVLLAKHKDAALVLLPAAGHIYYGTDKKIAIDSAYKFLESH